MSVKAEEHQFSIALTTFRGYLLQRQEVRVITTTTNALSTGNDSKRKEVLETPLLVWN